MPCQPSSWRLIPPTKMCLLILHRLLIQHGRCGTLHLVSVKYILAGAIVIIFPVDNWQVNLFLRIQLCLWLGSSCLSLSDNEYLEDKALKDIHYLSAKMLIGTLCLHLLMSWDPQLRLREACIEQKLDFVQIGMHNFWNGVDILDMK